MQIDSTNPRILKSFKNAVIGERFSPLEVTVKEMLAFKTETFPVGETADELIYKPRSVQSISTGGNRMRGVEEGEGREGRKRKMFLVKNII